MNAPVNQQYPQQAIEKLSDWIEDDSAAFNWLIEHGYKELVALKDAASRDPKAFNFLLQGKHIVLCAFVNAIWDDPKALQALINHKELAWAATANIINGDPKAERFLHSLKLDHYIVLAKRLQAKIRREGDESTSIFNIFKFK